ncbi:DUF2490 domain-containing protein [Pedobacter sp. MW01-1-1]|uniref:DUF2490 domain-containing protein n=1 Tax=Pedobacter sp. MW01-1-1 TaxID=3383027 RepID=UPI003FED7100
MYNIKQKKHKISLINGAIIGLILVCICNTEKVSAQSDQTLNQFWSEYALTHTFNDRWVAQLDMGLSTTAVSENKTVFGSIAQVYARGWVHYYPGNRWKLSGFYAYFYNHFVPEISQRQAPEWRSALQGIYRIKDGRFALSTRLRYENRHIYNPDSVYEAVNRIRTQLKFSMPINGKVIDEGVLYTFASDELFFKNKSKISGPNLFDRNRFTIGFGYALTRDMQVELSYANEILPRKSRTEIYNAFQINIAVNNLFYNLKKELFPHKKPIRALDDSN